MRRHFDRVESVLADEFNWGEVTRQIFRGPLIDAPRHYPNGFPPWFEFICDDPVSANWRLKPDKDAGPWALRVAYYGQNPTGVARAEEITRRLAG